MLNKEAGSVNKCIKFAQDAPIFDEKTFWEAEPDMEWIEW